MSHFAWSAWSALSGGSNPGGTVPAGTSVELGGAAIGGVLPSWL
jgi:hypothetical protein